MNVNMIHANGKPLNARLRQLDAKANAEKFRVMMMKLATLLLLLFVVVIKQQSVSHSVSQLANGV